MKQGSVGEKRGSQNWHLVPKFFILITDPWEWLAGKAVNSGNSIYKFEQKVSSQHIKDPYIVQITNHWNKL